MITCLAFATGALLAVQAKVIQALWLYMPPYVNSTAQITITAVSSTASAKRRRLQASGGSADVTTEFGVVDAHTVADTGTHLSSVIGGTKFLVSKGSLMLLCVICCVIEAGNTGNQHILLL